MKIRWITLIVLLVYALSGCEQGQGLTTAQPDLPSFSAPQQISPENPIPGPTQEIVEVLPSPTPLPGLPPQGDSVPMPTDPDIQKLIATAIEDLAQRLSIPATQINLLDASNVIWPNASLGCPKVGMMYAEVLTPGYRIILEANSKEYEYHAGINAEVFYCESPTPLIP